MGQAHYRKRLSLDQMPKEWYAGGLWSLFLESLRTQALPEQTNEGERNSTFLFVLD